MKRVGTCIRRTWLVIVGVLLLGGLANAQSVSFVGDFSYMTVGTIRPVRLQVQNSLFPNSIEIFLVSATSNGELSNGLGFSFSMFNGPNENEFVVRVTTDSFGNGYSEQFYMKSLAAVSPLTATTCRGSNWHFPCISQNIGSPPSGGGTTTNPPPSVSTIGVDERVQYWLVTPEPVEPAFRGYTVRFTIQPNNSVGVAKSSSSNTWGAGIGVDMYIDSSGNGRSETFYLKGLKKSDNTVYLSASSDNHFIASSQTISVRVAQVTMLKWVPYSAEHPIDDNPLGGGGSRHFADKNTVDETNDSKWRRVGIHIKITPAVANMVVRVRGFDVDDPSSSTEIDPNGAAGNDNRELWSGYTANLVTDSTGTAIADIRVSSRPGDNFRLAATVASQTMSTSNPLRQKFDSITTYSLDGTRLRVPDGMILSEWSPTVAVATDDEFISSPMLTIWRRLHIERDSMGVIKNNRISTSMGKILRDRTMLVTVLELDASAPSLVPNQLEGGNILYQDADAPGIFSNIILSNTDRKIKVRGLVPDTFDEFNDTAVLYDDDDFNHNDIDNNGDLMEEIPKPDVGMLQDSDNTNMNVLAVAYIRPVYDLSGEQGDVRFEVNSRGSVEDFDNIASEADADFWTIYLITAYQGEVGDDCDPNGEYCSVYRYLGNEGVMMFIEGYNDAADRAPVPMPADKYYRAIWAETVGGMFDRSADLVPGFDGPLCYPNSCVNFTNASIAKIRSAIKP